MTKQIKNVADSQNVHVPVIKKKWINKKLWTEQMFICQMKCFESNNMFTSN